MFPLADNNPSHSAPFITWTLIAINVFVFLIELSMENALALNRLLYQWGFVPAAFAHALSFHHMTTLFSMQFLHGGWLHLIGNMWILQIFGDNVEDRLGHFGYLIFYLTCGVLANFTQFFANPASTAPHIGASGAIAGIIGGYLILFPHAKINTVMLLGFIPIFFHVPAVVYAVIFFLLNWISGITALDHSHVAQQAEVAWWAHIGGFIAGIVLVKIFESPRQVENRFYQDEYYPW